MQIIPVLDLKGGLVVRGIAGRRELYKPVVSALCSTADPAGVEGERSAAGEGDPDGAGRGKLADDLPVDNAAVVQLDGVSRRRIGAGGEQSDEDQEGFFHGSPGAFSPHLNYRMPRAKCPVGKEEGA